MQKLLSDFETNPCLKTASKAVAYEKKHPMSLCLLDEKHLNIWHSIVVYVLVNYPEEA